jgi:hypothetical protein
MEEIIKNIRFEVIDEDGRQYSKQGADLAFSFQDNDKTLKIFVKTRHKERENEIIIYSSYIRG